MNFFLIYLIQIAQNEELGRHLITTRTIKPFEIILKEIPLFRGPSQTTPPVCLGCLNAIEPKDYINCEQCGWPLCGVECKNKDEHRFECELTVKRGKKVTVQEFTNPHPLYQCLSTARCLMLREKDAEKWKQINDLESLEGQRRGSMQWKADYESVCKFIIKQVDLRKKKNIHTNILQNSFTAFTPKSCCQFYT